MAALDGHRCLRIDGAEIIVSPFMLAELVRLLEKRIAERRSIGPDPRSVGDEPANNVALSELDLLKVFLNSCGSREAASRVWPDLVRDMRRAQKRFFKHRKSLDMREAKSLERQVDRALGIDNQMLLKMEA